MHRLYMKEEDLHKLPSLNNWEQAVLHIPLLPVARLSPLRAEPVVPCRFPGVALIMGDVVRQQE